MRHIMLTFALMLCASQVEAGVLFTPDTFTLSFKPIFNDTRTETFCWQCEDGDPSNDFRAVLHDIQDFSAEWTDFIPVALGGLNLQGTATNFLGLQADFSLRVKLTASGQELPESLTRPSVSFGVIPGRILGVNDGELLVIECCDGRVDGVEFRQAFFPSDPFMLPPGGLVTSFALELHLSPQIEYTPVVPEPASLLLLGSALAAAALRRRRRAETDR